MDIVKKFIGLILLLGCIGFVMHGRQTMPTTPPNGSNVLFQEDATLSTKVTAKVIMPMMTWKVDDYYLVKVATPENSPENWACTTIFSGGKWHR